MYVASTKPGGFQLEVTNNDSTLVICGLRVAVGAVDTQKVPAYLEVRPMLTPWADPQISKDPPDNRKNS